MIESLVDVKINEYSQMREITEKSKLSIPRSSLSEFDIFDQLYRSEVDHIRRSANEPFHLVQTHVILDTVGSMLTTFSYQIDNPDYNTDSLLEAPVRHMLLFATHLILFLRNIGLTFPSESCDKIVIRYMHLLESDGDVSCC